MKKDQVLLPYGPNDLLKLDKLDDNRIDDDQGTQSAAIGDSRDESFYDPESSDSTPPLKRKRKKRAQKSRRGCSDTPDKSRRDHDESDTDGHTDNSSRSLELTKSKRQKISSVQASRRNKARRSTGSSPTTSRSKQRQDCPPSQAEASEISSNRRYCTQTCLRGLRDSRNSSETPLDPNCPNAHLHGSETHQLTRKQFYRCLEGQRNESITKGIEPISQNEESGAAIFAVTLLEYGCRLIAKGIPSYDTVDLPMLKRELVVYRHLETVQGILVPVCLGLIPLSKAYFVGPCFMSYLLLMAHAGDDVASLDSKTRLGLQDQLNTLPRQLRGPVVYHGDLHEGNILQNEQGNLYVIDFERARIKPRRH
ncbi:MAG: hypothetical protein Q9160_006890 [Pyrenula sp. 1 TL-2023]